MNANIVNTMMCTLINSFNERNDNFFSLWTVHSKLIYENRTLTGNEIKEFWLSLNYKLNIKKYDTNIIGDRRANILLSGFLGDEKIIFTIYFQLALDNSRKYWIHSAIMQIFIVT